MRLFWRIVHFFEDFEDKVPFFLKKSSGWDPIRQFCYFFWKFWRILKEKFNFWHFLLKNATFFSKFAKNWRKSWIFEAFFDFLTDFLTFWLNFWHFDWKVDIFDWFVDILIEKLTFLTDLLTFWLKSWLFWLICWLFFWKFAKFWDLLKSWLKSWLFDNDMLTEQLTQLDDWKVLGSGRFWHSWFRHQ